MSMMTATFYPQDYTFNIASETELMRCFSERLHSKVILGREIELPLRAQYYFTWGESSGVYRYLVFKKPGWDSPRGVVFRVGSSNTEGATGGICDWCHSYGGSGQVGLLTTTVSSKRTVGMMLCRDLSCGDKIENAPSQSGRNPEVRILEVCDRIGRFFDETLREREL